MALDVVREVMFDGPQPPPGERWCFMCAAMFKSRCMDSPSGKAAISEASTSGERVSLIKIARLEKIALPETATAAGLANLGQLGLMLTADLCWSHVMAVKAGSPLAAAMPGMPGMAGLLGGR